MNTTENTETLVETSADDAVNLVDTPVVSERVARPMSECDDEYVRQKADDKKFKETVHWYALYVHSQHELQVHDYLMGLESERKKTRRGKSKKEDLFIKADPEKVKMECYVPLQRVRVKLSDRMVWKDKILIPGLVFVRCALNKRSALFESKVQEYITGFMSDKVKHRPQPIPDAQMETFRKLADSDYAFQMEAPSFTVGQSVMILAGPMAGHVAELVSKKEVISKTEYQSDRLGNKILDADGNPIPKHMIKLCLRLNDLLGAKFELGSDEVAIVPKGTKTKIPTE